MRAFVVEKYTGPLHEANILEPAVGDWGVLVRVVAVGLKLVNYEFRLLPASGTQLREITALVDIGAVRPIIRRTFPFDRPRKHSIPWQRRIPRQCGHHRTPTRATSSRTHPATTKEDHHEHRR